LFRFIITILFSYGNGQQQINKNKKCRQIAGNFECYADAVVQRGAHHPMEHVQGFIWSHWMPPLGECLRRIAPAAAMDEEFVETTQNTTKTQLLASNYGTFWSLVVYDNFIPQNGPSTQLINATSFVSMWNATIGAEELAHISRYQMLSGDKKYKTYKAIMKLVKKAGTYMCH
jgi:hypothetical protein